VSIELLAMVIVGGLGSIIGSWLGAAFILLMPSQMNQLIAWSTQAAGIDLGVETFAHIPQVVYGALIIVFLIVEPMGLGKLYGNIRNYLMLWPFGYARK
jgi:branched-chain amino acid transport system permease protein